MNSVDALRIEIRELADRRDTMTREQADLSTELREIEQRRRTIKDRQETIEGEAQQMAARITALEQALALLEERLPAEPLAPATPVAPEAEIDTDRGPRSTQPTRSTRPGGHSLDPLRVLPRRHDDRRDSPRPGGKRVRYTDLDPDNVPERIANPSHTDLERADLVYQILAENGAMAQYAIADEVRALMDCGRTTAVSITSHAVGILQHQRRILFTGQKAALPNKTRLNSPIWKARETPAEHASAGIPSDDEANPQTTRPPINTGGRVVIESGSFESKRSKH